MDTKISVENPSGAVSKPVRSSDSIMPDVNMHNTPRLPRWRFICVCLSLCAGLFLSLMDSTIVATAVYSISLEFGSLSTTFWVVLAYTLAYLAFATVFARVSDFSGRRAAVVASFVIFLAASLGAGWSPNLNALIACRTLQGVGGSGLYALSIILLVEVSPDEQKPIVTGMVGCTLAISGALGPLVGGQLTDHATWRWIFWLNGPCCAVALVLFLSSWPPSLDSAAGRRPIREFDWLGAFLVVAASSLVVFGLQEAAGGSVSWSSAQVVASLVVGCACWFVLFGWEFYIQHRKQHLAAAFPITILQTRALCAGMCSTLFTGFVSFTAIYFIPLRFQLVNAKSPAAAGIRLLPYLGAAAVGSTLGGLLSARRNRTFQCSVAAAALLILGAGLMTTLNSELGIEAKEYGFQVVLGIGTGLTFSTISGMTTFETAPRDHAVAQGVAAQVRILGGSIGIAAANGLIGRQFGIAAASSGGLLSPADVAAVEGASGAISTLNPAQAELVKRVYADAFSETMRVCIYVGVAALVASLLTWQRHPPHPWSENIKKRQSQVVQTEEAKVEQEGTKAEREETKVQQERTGEV